MSNSLLKQLAEKKEKLDSFRPLPFELAKNLNDWIKVELTYASNAIEGNTLTKKETALVVEKGLTVEGKTITEHLEAVNHIEAIKFIKKLSDKASKKITESDILEIHRLILQKIDDTNAGRYRKVAVRIAGARVILPNPLKVSELIKNFVQWLNKNNGEHPAKIAANAHLKFVSIHPFIDGNGRTARLLMNLILMQQGYPQAIIRNRDRKIYISAIEKAQLKNDLKDYYSIIYKAIDRSLDIYLKAAKESIK